MKHIESATNETFRTLISLSESKGIKKEGLFFVYGKNPIQDTLRESHLKVRYLLGTQENSDEVHRLHRFLSPQAETIFLIKPLFDELNLFGIPYPLLVCEIPSFPTWRLEAEPTVVCPFGNPNNVGAALRSTFAFNFSTVLTRESSHPLHPKSIRALSGNIFSHRIFSGPSIKELAPNPRLVILDNDGTDISQFNFPKNPILIIGEEGQGVPEHLPTVPRISIPIQKQQESLNAMVALSIAVYQYRVQYPL